MKGALTYSDVTPGWMCRAVGWGKVQTGVTSIKDCFLA